MLHRRHRRISRTQLRTANAHTHAHTMRMRIEGRATIVVQVLQISGDISLGEGREFGVD